MANPQITVARYHQMIELGVLQSGDPVELLEGQIVLKPRRSPRHDAAIDTAGDGIRHVLPPGWHTRINSAITTLDSEPEPDMAVILSPARRYSDHHPGPTEIGLIVEVADSSLDIDRIVKGRIYARARISNFWIVNLVDRQVEEYANPDSLAAEPAYAHHTDYLPGDSVPLTLNGQEVARLPVSDLLP